jgi:copper resistance protein B
MKRAALLLLASTISSPALAQHGGHSRASPEAASAAVSGCTPEHAEMGHCTVADAPPQPTEPAPSCTAEHAAMGHCTLGPPTAAPCTPEHAAMGHCTLPPHLSPPVTGGDPHAGPAMPARQAAPQGATCTPEHAAMGHCSVPAGHAEGLYFCAAAPSRSREKLAEEHGGLEAYRFLVDRLEATIGEGRDGYAWDAQFWYGGDIDKFWLKTEGEGQFGGELEEVEIQALWSHAIDPWFDLQAGVRQDLNSGPDRTHLVLGIQGLAPYWFEVEGTLFLSNKGDLTARVEAEYDLRLTQSLIFQPRAEIDFSFQDVPELRLGSGISTAEFGARLRYELYPEAGLAVVAPYIGAQYERSFGDAARFRRASGEDAGGWRFLVGVRTWF